jgi:hypothetical protein
MKPEQIVASREPCQYDFLKKVIKLNNWFIVHQLSAYRKADQKTRDHLDELYEEFNRRWKLLLRENKLEDIPPQSRGIDGKEAEQ